MVKAEAAGRRRGAVHLDSAAQGNDGGSGDLIVHQDDLGAVGHEAFVLHGKLYRQADIAGVGADKGGSGSTMQAAAALKHNNFAMGSALKTTADVWTSQVKSVLQATAHISNHLDFSKKQHAKDDAQIAADIKGRDGTALPVSRLNDYFT